MEQMSKRKKLFQAKDHLVSGESFDIYWNDNKKRAETGINIDKKDLSRYYESSAYNSYKSNIQNSTDRIYFTIQKLMFHYKKRILRQHHAGNKIMDYGGGAGGFAFYLSKKGYDTTVIEPNKTARDSAKSKGVIAYKSIDELPALEVFNVITLWHVLEHLPKPERVLINLRQLMKPKDVLVIAAPNFNSLDAKLYQKDWAALDVPRHLWHFTSQGLIPLVESLGFEFKKKYPLWFDAFYIAYLSEKHKGNRFSLISGLWLGFRSNFKALFNGEYSSLIYVFNKYSI